MRRPLVIKQKSDTGGKENRINKEDFWQVLFLYGELVVMENPQMLREIANDKITPKKTDRKVENDLYENDGLEYENDVFAPCDI